MISRLLTTVVLLSTGLAHADGGQTELVPSCADIDAQRDTLSPELRTRAVQRLTRVLEREELLVVTTGCVDRYVVSHEQVGDTLVVRVAGPHGIRRMRNGSVDKLDTMYARMVESLLTPPPPVPKPEPAPAAAEPAAEESAAEHAEAQVDTAAVDPYSAYAAADQDPVIDAVAPDEIQVVPDRIFYGQLAVGSVGTGWGMGYRRHAAEHLAFDVSLAYAGDYMSSSLALGFEAFYVPRPRETMTPYVGGGMSLASEQDDAMTGDGLRAEITAGLSFSRTGTFRWFTQVDAALPLYSLQTYDGASTYRPSISFSLGLGF